MRFAPFIYTFLYLTEIFKHRALDANTTRHAISAMFILMQKRKYDFVMQIGVEHALCPLIEFPSSVVVLR